MDKNLLKYNKWNAWLKRQGDHKSAYAVFLYWLEVKQDYKSISVNFRYSPSLLKKSLEDQYVDNKYDKVFFKLSKKYDGDFYSDLESVAYIKSRIGNLAYSSKELYEMLNNLFVRGFIKETQMLTTVRKKIDYINTFFKNTNRKDVIRYCNKQDICYNEYESESSHIIAIEPDQCEMSLLASPSWCLLYNKKYMKSYFKIYRILLLYVFNKNNGEFSLLGVNIIKDFDFDFVVSSFDMNNSMIIDPEIFYMLKNLRSQEIRDIITVHQDSVKMGELMIAALNEVDDDAWIRSFLENNECCYKEFKLIIKTIIRLDLNAVFLRFVSIVEDTNFMESWVQDNIVNMDNVSKIERKVIFDYLVKYKSFELMELFLSHTKYSVEFMGCFNILRKKMYSELMSSEYVLMNLDKLLPNDLKYIIDNKTLKKKISDTTILHCVKYIQDNNAFEVLYFLKKQVGFNLLAHLDTTLFFKFSIKDRIYFLKNAKLTLKSVYFINVDNSLPRNEIVKHHICNNDIAPQIFFQLEKKCLKSNYQLFYRNCRKKHYHTLHDMDLKNVTKIYPLYKIRNLCNFDLKYKTQNDFTVNLIKELIQTKNLDELCKKIIMEEKGGIKPYQHCIYALASLLSEDFSRYYSITKDIAKINNKSSVDYWVDMNQNVPTQDFLDLASEEEIFDYMLSKEFLHGFATPLSFYAMMKKLRFTESPYLFFTIMKILKKTNVTMNYNMFQYLEIKFKKKYGNFTYIKCKMGLKIKE
jgi:hypothetical protein